MSSYNFNGHKLAYHPGRVAEYLATGDCMPLYAEISPVGNCNHRCLFCAYDFIGHPNRRLDTAKLKETISDMAGCGVKSIVLAGEGEPLLHPDIDDVIHHTKSRGIDVGLFTNGQLLDEKMAARILPHLTFVRFSFNGGTDRVYADVHQVKVGVFNRVVSNMSHAAELKRQLKLNVDIGAQYVLISENMAVLPQAVETIKKTGLDYLAIKPFVLQRTEQNYSPAVEMSSQRLDQLIAQAERFADEQFAVVVRKDSFSRQRRRSYRRCRGCSFITVINSAGDVATCLPYWDKPEFVYGNICKESFRTIWQGPERQGLKARLEQQLDAHHCPSNCRPDAINAYLSEICNPSVRHLNFI